MSTWEITTKRLLGNLPPNDVLLAAYSKQLDGLCAVRLSVTEDHALLAGRLDWDHRDPVVKRIAPELFV